METERKMMHNAAHDRQAAHFPLYGDGNRLIEAEPIRK